MKILTIAEQKDGSLVNISLEPIGAAKALGGEVSTAIIGSGIETISATLSAKGSKVYAFDHAGLKHFHDEAYACLLKSLIDREKPNLVLGSATFYGKSLMARLCALCSGGMASDCTGITVEGGVVTALRPAYGGSVYQKIRSSGTVPFFVTLRPKAFPEAADADGGQVIKETVPEAVLETKAKVTGRVSESGGRVNLTEADIVVAAGRGIRAAENFKLVEDLASTLKGAVGASRAIVDAGWVPYQYQVGQTGKTVNPKLYFAVGVSGAVQHLVGMRSSKTIVAINRDKDAPIFNIATFGIVGDLFEIMPALTKKFKEAIG